MDQPLFMVNELASNPANKVPPKSQTLNDNNGDQKSTSDEHPDISQLKWPGFDLSSVLQTTDRIQIMVKDQLQKSNQLVDNLKDSVVKPSLELGKTGAMKAWNVISDLVMEEVPTDSESEDESSQTTGLFGGWSSLVSNVANAAQQLVPKLPISQSNPNTVSTTSALTEDDDEILLQPLHDFPDLILRDPNNEPASSSTRERYQKLEMPTDGDTSTQTDLLRHPKVSRLYSELVPQTLSQQDFWKRYLFWRSELLSAKQIKRQMIIQAARQQIDEPETIVSKEPEPDGHDHLISPKTNQVISEISHALEISNAETKTAGWDNWE